MPIRAEDFLNPNYQPDTNLDTPELDLNISPIDITAGGEIDESLEDLLEFSFPQTHSNENVSQIGVVEYIGDGVCKISGIDNAKIEDVVTIKTQGGGIQLALILGIANGLLETVVMGDYSRVKRGDQALANNEPLSIGTGQNVLGRVINPLGKALDGKGDVEFETRRPIEYPGPSIMMRKPIYEPMSTGIMVIDTTIPIGKGQRELVIGDRKSGKSRTVLDTICNQKGRDMICVYVGVGLQAAKAKDALFLLEKRGAMEFTTMVLALADDPPTLQYIAPYAGVAIAEHFMYQGRACLVVYDDLSKQAKAYRQVSLLLKRSPGRDAYPGDIFFLHSRLLERAAKLSENLGEGSITALPVAETQSGDVSDYIITNLMSITDGHVYLDANLMNEGIMPAVNSGLSVSRIGGAVQTKLLRKVGELASRQMARYNEVKSFETMNTEVAEDTLRDIRRGKRVVNMFAQKSSLNLTTDEEVLLLALATSGRVDNMELDQLDEFKPKIVEFYREQSDFDSYKNLCMGAGKDLPEVDGYIDELIKRFQKANPDYKDSITLSIPAA